MYQTFSFDGELYSLELDDYYSKEYGDSFTVTIYNESISPREFIASWSFPMYTEAVKRFRSVLARPEGYVYDG